MVVVNDPDPTFSPGSPVRKTLSHWTQFLGDPVRGVITLVPDRPIVALRGFLQSMRTTGVRKKKGAVVTVVDSSGWNW